MTVNNPQWRWGQEEQQRCLCCTETRCRCFCFAFQIYPRLGLHVELPHLWMRFRQIKVLLVIAQPLSADQRRGEWSCSLWNLTIQLVFILSSSFYLSKDNDRSEMEKGGVWIPSVCIMSRFRNTRTLSSLKHFHFLLICFSGVEM